MSDDSPLTLMTSASADLAALLGEAVPATPIMKIVPDVGIHRNVSDTVYHRHWDACSNSRLTILYDRTPAHLRQAIDFPPKDTPATLIGKAIHTAILEPGKFWKYVRGPEHDRRSNANKAVWEGLENEHGIDRVLKPAVYDAIEAIRKSVQARPTVMKLLIGSGHESELSIVWRDEKTGVLCKGRVDHISPDIPGLAVVDLKSTEDASREAFEKSIFAYGYHRQGAMYLEGLAANGIDVEHYVVIAVEKKPPYAVGIYRMDAGALAAGRAQLDLLLPQYQECIDGNVWHDYPDEVLDISLPYWAFNRIDQETKGLT